MKRFINLRNVALIVACLAASATIVAQSVNVYVGGQHNMRATIWKNGMPEYLTAGLGLVGAAIVENGDIYALGLDMISGMDVKVWKNGEELYFLTNVTGGYPGDFPFAVSNGDVYVLAYDNDGKKLWKNGVVETSYANDATQLNSIFTDGSDVYVGGRTIYGNAAVWKNGNLLYTLGSGGEVYHVFVDDDNVYAAGYEWDGSNYVIQLWKNDEILYTLGMGLGVVAGLYVSDGIVYVINNSNGAEFWIDGVLIPLAEDAATVRYNSVFVFNDDVYVGGNAGTYGNMAAVWKNGELIWLDSGNANSVFVVERTCIVTFAGEEINIAPQTIVEGGLVTQPATPEREGYNFDGWFTDNGTFLNEWDFEANVVTQDTTLYAKWKENTGIADIEIAGIEIYPNPVKDVLQIESCELSVNRIEIVDLSGNVIYQFDDLKNQINVSVLTQGIYFVKLKTDKGTITKKLIKE